MVSFAIFHLLIASIVASLSFVLGGLPQVLSIYTFSLRRPVPSSAPPLPASVGSFLKHGGQLTGWQPVWTVVEYVGLEGATDSKPAIKRAHEYGKHFFNDISGLHILIFGY